MLYLTSILQVHKTTKPCCLVDHTPNPYKPCRFKILEAAVIALLHHTPSDYRTFQQVCGDLSNYQLSFITCYYVTWLLSPRLVPAGPIGSPGRHRSNNKSGDVAQDVGTPWKSLWKWVRGCPSHLKSPCLFSHTELIWMSLNPCVFLLTSYGDSSFLRG